MTSSDAPIVLLPGLDGTGKFFSSLIKALAPKTSLTISYPPDEQLDYAALTEFVISKLPDTKCVLLCESFAGPLGARIAARLPSRIAGIVFLGSFITAPRLRSLAPLNALITYRELPASLIDFAMLSNVQSNSINAFRAIVSTLSPMTVRSRIRSALSCDELEAFRGTTCPVLVVQGLHDWILGTSSARTIREARAGVTTVFIDGPHLLALTHPDEVANEVKKFIQL